MATAILMLFLRRPAYEMFINLHAVLPFVATIALWPHVNIKVSGVRASSFIALAALAVLLLIRGLVMLLQRLVLKRYCGAAYVRLRGNASLVEINLIQPLAVKPGQFVYLWIPSVGFWSMFQTHPFIGSWEEGQTIWISVRPQRGFSRRLKYFADEERPTLAWVDGPYGNPPDFRKYENAIFIAEGVGVTASLLAIKCLLQQYRDRAARIQSITLLWQIESDGLQDWAKPWFDELLKLDEDYILKVNFFITYTEISSDTEEWGSHERVRKFFGPGTLLNRLLLTFSAGFSGKTILSVAAQQYLRNEVRTLATVKPSESSIVELDVSDFEVRRPWMPWT